MTIDLVDEKLYIINLLAEKTNSFIKESEIFLGEKKKKMEITRILPKECICKLISLTTPKDACRSSVVSSAFKELADSDDTWEAFLPSDWQDLIAQSSSPNLISMPKRQLYLHLSDHPLLLANQTMSFSLAKESGKKCYMIGARGLGIAWGDTPPYWNWVSPRQSRFPQVAELQYVWWFDVRGALNTVLLSPKTTYEVLFIFRFGRRRSGFTNKQVNYSLATQGGMNTIGQVVLDPPEIGVKHRDDGWMEFKVGEFFTEDHEQDDDDDGSLSFRVWETDNYYTKNGIFVEGVEFRPRSTNT
ncbi:F-box protein PP2-B11-like [Prosopis cineraria]|uniref:F-box protein PP2-B11-like n=1 Tax=Prosopis cineraria TaxID=364024 RepID=UPI0024104390|nr:F-box protein PP2-B11-like [Prosopis cineraria]XP_054816068.1 F-box protein PP2-B11-like [Prosopis cineraria]XP_054816069.1 F-box protein PP2-B11-like [Prosopis cineraria]XP_054816070.1 F-box protein PP2-B11-like [Prosopis cineraria]